MKGLKVTVRPVADAMARLGLLTIKVPRGSFGYFDPSIQRFVIALPRLT